MNLASGSLRRVSDFSFLIQIPYMYVESTSFSILLRKVQTSLELPSPFVPREPAVLCICKLLSPLLFLNRFLLFDFFPMSLRPSMVVLVKSNFPKLTFHHLVGPQRSSLCVSSVSSRGTIVTESKKRLEKKQTTLTEKPRRSFVASLRKPLRNLSDFAKAYAATFQVKPCQDCLACRKRRMAKPKAPQFRSSTSSFDFPKKKSSSDKVRRLALIRSARNAEKQWQLIHGPAVGPSWKNPAIGQRRSSTVPLSGFGNFCHFGTAMASVPLSRGSRLARRDSVFNFETPLLNHHLYFPSAYHYFMKMLLLASILPTFQPLPPIHRLFPNTLCFPLTLLTNISPQSSPVSTGFFSSIFSTAFSGNYTWSSVESEQCSLASYFEK